MNYIEELAAKLGIEIDGASFATAEKVLGAVRGGMVALAAAGGAVGLAIAGAVAKTAEYADATAKAAERTGIAVNTLQALQYAAERADVSAGDLEGALRFAAKRGVKDLEGELRRAAEQFERMPDGAGKAALAMQLFGKQGTALIPMLNGGAAGLDEMMSKARDMGLVLGPETQEQAALLKDTMEDVQGYLRGFAYTVAGPFLKPIREALEKFIRWFRESRPVIEKWAEAVGRVVGGALKYTLQLFEPVVDIFMRFQTWLLSSMPGMIAGFAALGFAIGAPWMAALLAIGLFLGALEEVWGWMTGKRHTLLEEAFGSFDEFKKGFEDNPVAKFLLSIKEAADHVIEGLTKVGRLVTFLKTGTTPGIQEQQEYSENMHEAYRRTGLAEVPGAQDAIRADPRFNELVVAGDWPSLDREYGPHSVFRKRVESAAAGFTPDYTPPAMPTPLLTSRGEMNLTLNVTAPPGAETKTWAASLAAELNPHLEKFWDGKVSPALPAVEGR
jgi:hypothetical protein